MVTGTGAMGAAVGLCGHSLYISDRPTTHRAQSPRRPLRWHLVAVQSRHKSC